MSINVLAQRQRNPRFGIAPIVRLQQIPHDDFGLDRVRHLNADGTFSGNGRKDMDALRLERRGDIVVERGNFFQLHAGRRMQFIAGDGRALGDIP